MDAQPLLQVRDLHGSIGTSRGAVHAVDDVSRAAGRGQALGVRGESGSGEPVMVSVMGQMPRGSGCSGGRLRPHDHRDAVREGVGGLPPCVRGRAQLLTSGGTYDDGLGARGPYVQPTVYGRVEPLLAIAREEVFGPVLVSMASRTRARRCAWPRPRTTDWRPASGAPTSPGGFGSPNASRRVRWPCERRRAGDRDTLRGGYKTSGYGRERGLYALHDYAQVKTISLALRRRKDEDPWTTR